jgi:hypothetical protein
MAKKEELLRFLDKRVFEPILQESPAGKNGRQREELEDVQKRTRMERERYQDYPNAEKLIQMYNDDLHSEKAREVNAKLRRLHLPTLGDVKGELERLAN